MPMRFVLYVDFQPSNILHTDWGNTSLCGRSLYMECLKDSSVPQAPRHCTIRGHDPNEKCVNDHMGHNIREARDRSTRPAIRHGKSVFL